MPRQKTRHTQILSEKTRKSTYKRRVESLFKKGNELSILCGVDVAMIIQDPENGHSTLWPSQEKVMDGLVKFSAIPERERLKKMVLQEKFLKTKMQDMVEKLMKHKKTNEEREMGFLTNQLIYGANINELDMRQLSGLYQFADENLKKLQSSTNGMTTQPLNRDQSSRCHPSLEMITTKLVRTGQEYGETSTARLMEDTREENWFGDDSIQNNFGFFNGTNMLPQSTEGLMSFNDGNQGEMRDALGNMCPMFYPQLPY